MSFSTENPVASDADRAPNASCLQAQKHSEISKSKRFSLVHNDKRILSLDFISEIGELLICFGSAISAAATAENVEALELALRHAQSTLIEGISEFKLISNKEGRGDD